MCTGFYAVIKKSYWLILHNCFFLVLFFFFLLMLHEPCYYNIFFVFFQRAQAALQAVNTVQSGGLALTGGPGGESLLLHGQSPVLRIIVENLFYPVTLEVLHQVFIFLLLLCSYTNVNRALHCMSYFPLKLQSDRLCTNSK